MDDSTQGANPQQDQPMAGGQQGGMNPPTPPTPPTPPPLQQQAQDASMQQMYDPSMGGQQQSGSFDPAAAMGGDMSGGQMTGDDSDLTQTSPPKPPSPPANFQLGQLIPQQINVQVAQNNLQYDQQHFLRLLAGSISLTKDEKRRIVDSIPKLRQEQIDELIRIFEEERYKFAELGAEHVPKLEKLAQQHAEDWKDIEMGEEQKNKANSDEDEAEKLRKQMGLS